MVEANDNVSVFNEDLFIQTGGSSDFRPGCTGLYVSVSSV